jgi:preprotein translocase subunit SecE
MGRLLRKKPSSEPKKKKPANEASEAVGEENGAGRASVVTAVKDGRKMPVPAPRKPSGGFKWPERLGGKYVDQAAQFLRDVKVELKKVAWPSRKQTIGSTVVVIILVMIISMFLGIVDIGLSGLIRAVI